MRSLHQTQVERIHDSQTQLVLSITGGGTAAIGELLAVPGGSRSLLEAVVPYHEAALAGWLGGMPDEACSAAAARAMAMAGLLRATDLVGDVPHPLAGIGATAALVTSRPKRGEHRIHVAWQTRKTTGQYSLWLEKEARTRREEEELAEQLVLLAMAEGCEVEKVLTPVLRPGEEILQQRVDASPEWQELLSGVRPLVTQRFDPTEVVPAVFPGAFNPLHQGHLDMASTAERLLGKPLVFELSISNVDKPPLDFLTIDERVRQFGELPVALTRAATFVEKSSLFPDATFVVGADTILRIGDSRYYGDDPDSRDAALDQLAHQGARFLVFGRHRDGSFETLSHLELPMRLRQLCIEVPEEEFRHDVSSTQLRNHPDQRW